MFPLFPQGKWIVMGKTWNLDQQGKSDGGDLLEGNTSTYACLFSPPPGPPYNPISLSHSLPGVGFDAKELKTMIAHGQPR